MMLMTCPFCGARPESEFVYGGDATLVRPADNAGTQAYTGYLYLRKNPKGWHEEFWVHRHGCGAWLRVRRHTVTHEIASCRLAAGAGQSPDSVQGEGQ